MAKHGRSAKGSGKGPVKGGGARKPAAPGGEGECRCKEMSKKTPRELLKVMVDDLSFWKKKK